MNNYQELSVTSEELLAELNDEELGSASGAQRDNQTITVDIPNITPEDFVWQSNES
ncbi:MAG: hypothetical protein V7K53_21805 [Nostoc sp.]|uniref:hypothetical protein n=1 Tax=Nostoc sp. TaxID=1180 RepID=UPI002FFBE260